MALFIRGSQKQDKRKDTFCRRKGTEHAVDHICHSRNFVAAGIGQRLHDGRGHSPPPGHRRRGGAGSIYSGAKMMVRIRTPGGEGKVFEKGVVSRPEKFFEPTKSSLVPYGLN